MTEEFIDPLRKDPDDLEAPDELDAILGFSDGSKPIKETVVDKPVVSIETDISTTIINSMQDSDPIPNMAGKDTPADYLEMVERIRTQYKLLPVLDYNVLYRELAELSLESNPSPTLQVLNDEIQKVQAAKDRLSEILINTIRVYNFKKRAVDILTDSWGKFTSEKNAEARKGDAAWRLSSFSIDFALAEDFFKACTHVLRNLDSIHDSLSRRITIIQVTVKLQDIGRGALPDFDFTKSAAGIDELVEGKREEESPKDGTPKLEEF
jgi:hypothetical protein